MVLNIKPIYMPFISANIIQTRKPNFMVTASITIMVVSLHLIIGWVLLNTVYGTKNVKSDDTQRLDVYLTSSTTINVTNNKPANKVDLIKKPTQLANQIATQSTSTTTADSSIKQIPVIKEQESSLAHTQSLQSSSNINVLETTATATATATVQSNTEATTITNQTTDLSTSSVTKPDTETTSVLTTPNKTNNTKSNVVANNQIVNSGTTATSNTKADETITPVIKTTNMTLLASDARWDKKPNLNVQAEINSIRTYKSGDIISVTFKLDVDKKGKITNAELINATKHSRINRRLIGQVKKGRFYPFTKQGIPVSGHVVLPFSIKVL